MSSLSPGRVRRTLADICDTFVPGSEGRPSASHLGVPEAFLAVAATRLRGAERRQLEVLLSLWDARVMTLAGGGGLPPLP